MQKKIFKMIGKTVLVAACVAAAVTAFTAKTASAENLNCVWKQGDDGKLYWYENGTKQGTYDDKDGVMGDGTIRGREIYDPASDGWYWLDAVYDGAKAVNKEVWMPYIYQNEKEWNDQDLDKLAGIIGAQGEQVKKAIKDGAGKWVRYDKDGKMIKGWYMVQGYDKQRYASQDGNIYYYDPTTGLMAKGSVVIDGQAYMFDDQTGKLTWGNPPAIPDRSTPLENESNDTPNTDPGQKNEPANNGDTPQTTTIKVAPIVSIVDSVWGKKWTEWTLEDYVKKFNLKEETINNDLHYNENSIRVDGEHTAYKGNWVTLDQVGISKKANNSGSVDSYSIKSLNINPDIYSSLIFTQMIDDSVFNIIDDDAVTFIKKNNIKNAADVMKYLGLPETMHDEVNTEYGACEIECLSRDRVYLTFKDKNAPVSKIRFEFADSVTGGWIKFSKDR